MPAQNGATPKQRVEDEESEQADAHHLKRFDFPAAPFVLGLVLTPRS